MELRVDTAIATARLEEPENTARLVVVVVGESAGGETEVALRAFGARQEADHAWIELDAIKAAAAGRVSDGWLADFNEMVEFARSRGWLSEDGTAVRAHIEHVEAPAPEKRRFLR
jgi:hypothetical protein